MALIVSSPSSSKLCEQCGKSSKYCCPKCSIRSCSLSCVQLHKKLQDCDGEREKTAFVKVKDFSDFDLLNDYRLLEETGRYIEGVSRSKRQKHFGFQPYLPGWLHRLKTQCQYRGINLRLLPNTFTKRVQNSTRYIYNKRIIAWKLEWYFTQTNQVKIQNGVLETTPLSEVLEKLLKDGDESESLQIYQGAGVSGLKLLLQSSLPETHPNFGYYELDANEPLKTVLKGRTVLEYPSITVVINDYIHGYKILDPETKEGEIREELRAKEIKPILIDKRDLIDENKPADIVLEPKKISKFFDF